MDIYNHPTIKEFSDNKKERIWFAYREKYPNLKWGLIFFSAWFIWTMGWMTASQFIDHHYLSSFSVRIATHFFLSLVIGAIGGVMLIGYFLLPIRKKQFFNYLNSKTTNEVLRDLLTNENDYANNGINSD